MRNIKLTFTLLLFTMLSTEFALAQDWPQLNKYKEANAKLETPAPGEKRVVFMGNSITEGWSNHNPEFFEGKPYINRGIGGQTTPQMLVRFRQDVIDLKPEVVVILAGINDIAGNTGPSTVEMIEDNLISMAQLAKANGIKVVLSSVLPALDFSWRPGMEPAPKVIALNKMIKRYADENGLVYLDYFSAMADAQQGLKSEYTYDGVHPNKAGYEVMAPLAEAAIAKAMKQKQPKGRSK
ncbi:SGNH/GDSL hydrolase family protein [Pontibacter anaerobius]|uniref:SGNH/GDSL hydrolase family protein n=1 Tax=Pontibacter anaerobius TaxID=2993940 RepID=A0ABT3REG9_9BACT|nr:SGNH/GDSL hydrolase family protein [Pontibacter anaerobius]MCX2740258.1 SGNH/GDSL hydrolase family protein [Pontibacter anaerobius]